MMISNKILTPLFALAVVTLVVPVANSTTPEAETAAVATSAAAAWDAEAAAGAVDTKTSNDEALVDRHDRFLLDARQQLIRSLQDGSSSSSNGVCASEAATAQACLDENVGNTTATPEGQDCMSCYLLKQQVALDDFRKDPTIECEPLNDNVCLPVTDCACLEPCDNEFSALFGCSLTESFASGGIDLNCTISCTGTNSSVTDDALANSTDDFVGGLCRGEEAAVKLCLESMGSSLDQCGSCLSTTQAARISSSTTCSDLQQITCTRIGTCPCVEDCKTELLALWNCDIDFTSLDYPQLDSCDQTANCAASAGGGSSGGGSSTSGAPIHGPGTGKWYFVAAAAVATVAATAMTTAAFPQ